jgi:hypothetical protein
MLHTTQRSKEEKIEGGTADNMADKCLTHWTMVQYQGN